MRTTDQFSPAIAPLETRLPLSAFARVTRAVNAAFTSIFGGRRSNSLADLSDRQLRDIGLTQDMLDMGSSDANLEDGGLGRMRKEPPLPVGLLLLLRGST